MELDLSNRSLLIFQALSSETRLKIIYFLSNQKKSISEIADYLQISKAITTRHVQQMEDAGLLASERGVGKNRNKKMVFLKLMISIFCFQRKFIPNSSSILLI